MEIKERSRELRQALRDRSMKSRRDGMILELTEQPDLYRNTDGEVVGVDAWVKLWRGVRHRDLQEVRVDPHRILVNPPLRSHNRQGDLVDDPEKAFWDVLWDSVLGTPNPRGWRTRGTVTTVFSGAGDGQVQCSDTTYSVARSGAGSLTVNTANTIFAIGQRVPAGNFQCVEGFVSFDTSAIGDTDTVSVVTLDLWLTTDNSATDFTVEARDRSWSAGGLTTADYVAGASLGGLTRVASIAISGIGATGAYKTLTSDAAFLTVTNIKTGSVEILLHSSRHSGNNAPAGEEQILVSSADETGTTQDPKLTITHTAVGGGPTLLQSRPNRIWRRR